MTPTRMALLATVFSILAAACAGEPLQETLPNGSVPAIVATSSTRTSASTTPPGEPDQPQWQRTRQETWYYAASVHADNTPAGTPFWARRTWDDIVQVDPDAPLEIQPFWAMKTGDASRLTDAFFEEIRERKAAGFRVIFTLKDEAATPQDLREVVEEMARRDALPWGVGLWNELDFGGRTTPQEFSDILTEADLPATLEALHREFAVMVSPPGFASFANVIIEGYGEVVKDLFADRPGVFMKVHSYGHLQPKYWVELDLKTRVREAVGLPDALVIIEETANSFVGERQDPKPGVGDEQGAEFMRAAMYAGMQSEMPTAHFMLYHKWSNWNDISDPVEGALRQQVARDVFEWMRATGDNDPPGALVLENPQGKELELSVFN